MVQMLEACQRNYLGQILLQSFRWGSLVDDTRELQQSLRDRNIDGKAEAVEYFNGVLQTLVDQEKVANKFVTQLYAMLSDKAALDYAKICERTKSAVAWFLPKFDADILLPTQEHIEAWKIKKRTKKYVEELKSMLLDFRRKKEQLAHCVTIADILTKEGDLSEIVAAVGQPERAKDESVASVDEDVVKDTKTISLDFYGWLNH